jgi:hypothetical protein
MRMGSIAAALLSLLQFAALGRAQEGTGETLVVPGNGTVTFRPDGDVRLYFDHGEIRLSGNEAGYFSTDPTVGIPGKYGKEGKTPMSGEVIGLAIYQRKNRWFVYEDGMLVRGGEVLRFRVNDSDLQNRGSFTFRVEPEGPGASTPPPREPIPEDGPVAGNGAPVWIGFLGEPPVSLSKGPKIPSGDRRLFGVQFYSNNDLRVRRVLNPSPAYQAGIRAGDRLGAIAGASVSTFEEFSAAFNRLEIGKVADVAVIPYRADREVLRSMSVLTAASVLDAPLRYK